MSTKKAGGSAKNLRDSQPKYLGVKRADGTLVKAGDIIVRQRGTQVTPGTSVRIGRDHTLFATRSGIVSFRTIRKTHFDGKMLYKKAVHVIPSPTVGH